MGVSITTVLVTLMVLSVAMLTAIIYSYVADFKSLITRTVSPSLMVIGSIMPYGDVKPYAFEVSLRNYSPSPINLTNASAIIVSGSRVYNAVLVLGSGPPLILGGGVRKAYIYPLSTLPPGNYYVEVFGPFGSEAVTTLFRLYSTVPASFLLRVSVSNNSSNPAVINCHSFKAVAWVSRSVKGYVLSLKLVPLKASEGVRVRALLIRPLSNSVIRVGGNPSVILLRYPNQVIASWGPIEPVGGLVAELLITPLPNR